MNYLEAKNLAQAWTIDHDIHLDGWRSVIALLLQRVNSLEQTNSSLHDHIKELTREIEALSLDLGIKQQDFRLPNQEQLDALAETIRELEARPKDKKDTPAW